MGRWVSASAMTLCLLVTTLVVGASARHVAAAAPPAAVCAKSEGPGIPAPTGLPAGVPGFHAQWYGQRGYPSPWPRDRSTATVAEYNSGSPGGVGGPLREGAYLGTWGPEAGAVPRCPPRGGGTDRIAPTGRS